MNSKRISGALFAVCTVSLVSSLALAGATFVLEGKDVTTSGSTVTEILIDGKNIKITESGSSEDFIYNGQRRQMITVDHLEKRYMTMDVETAKEMYGGMREQSASFGGEANRMMQEALKNVPADQRAMVEEMMKNKMPQGQMPQTSAPSVSEVKKTKERAKKAGYPTVKYEIWQDGRKAQELWVTDWDNVKGGSDVQQSFEDMAAFSRELMEATGGAAHGDDSAFEYMKEINGFPVMTREFDDSGELRSEDILRSAEGRSIDPDDFEPPSGYKRQEMFGR
ncbi:MAG: DUF4412 domain-containing protein [Gammaproteobacteria bacterium]|nr:DUF4412 domain-containing protein [Gammaproteobacteria bacterium]